ncbi:MAG: hypothetical protein K6A29_02845 [Lachnospiraceae bacterium]|nr:hypothetical protein [Lachnospiraceae bacterium]
MKNIINAILDFLRNINEKYRIINEQARKNQRDLINYDFAHAAAFELGECFRGERFPLCAEIRGANSFSIEKVKLSDDHTKTQILMGLQRDSLIKCGAPEVYEKMTELMNQCIFNQVRYFLIPSCGSDFPLMFPMLSHGITIRGVRETASEVQIAVLVNWAPDRRI